jgi:hypothetical protein
VEAELALRKDLLHSLSELTSEDLGKRIDRKKELWM